jgi:hypothetical protein
MLTEYRNYALYYRIYSSLILHGHFGSHQASQNHSVQIYTNKNTKPSNAKMPYPRTKDYIGCISKCFCEYIALTVTCFLRLRACFFAPARLSFLILMALLVQVGSMVNGPLFQFPLLPRPSVYSKATNNLMLNKFFIRKDIYTSTITTCEIAAIY